MKNLIQITTVLFLLVQTIGFSQAKKAETISKGQSAKSEIDTVKLKSFIGKYLLEEADFTLEIVQENEKTEHQTEGGSQLLLPDFIDDVGHYGEGPRINDIMSGDYIPPPQASNSSAELWQHVQEDK